MVKQSAYSGFTVRWLLQAVLGLLLIVLLTVHLMVNHWVAPHGLLTYADILQYYDHPTIVWMESTFLVVVILHCVLGLHSILLDLDLQAGIALIFTILLILIGAIAIIYGLWLIRTIALLRA